MDNTTSLLCGCYSSLIILILLSVNKFLKSTALWLYTHDTKWKIVEFILRILLMLFPARIVDSYKEGILGRRAWMLIYVPGSGFIGEMIYINPVSKGYIVRSFE